MEETQMKITLISLACLLSLPLFAGCGQTEDTPESVVSAEFISTLPADDDIEGLYGLGIPKDWWYNPEDPVVYTKYLRATLLRKFGNLPEIHIVADIELKKRQRLYPTLDEYIQYLQACCQLWPSPQLVKDVKDARERKAEAKPFVMVYGTIYTGTPSANVLKGLEPLTPSASVLKGLETIYQRELSRDEEIDSLLAIAGNTEKQAALDWQVHREDNRSIHVYLLHNLRIVWYPARD